MAWDKEYKIGIEAEVINFKNCCRFQKITDQELYDDVFYTKLSFNSFQTTLRNQPLALMKDKRNYKAMQEVHQELLLLIASENNKFLKDR